LANKGDTADITAPWF